MPARLVGIDLGHTHLRVAVADDAGEVLAERATAIDVDRSAAEALDAAARLTAEALAEAGADPATAAAVGLPGPVDHATGEVGSLVILENWRGVRPAAELEARLGVPVELDNDANLGALAEHTRGAATGARTLVYVKVSSGVGAGLIVEGRPYRGSAGAAGELGHVVVDPTGPLCRCGNRGCLETIVASGALVRLLRPAHGRGLTAEDVVRRAVDGDVACRRVLGDAGHAIGQALATVCNVLNPDHLVVGGELGAAGEPLLGGIRAALDRYALPAAMEGVQLRQAALGPRAEVLGAVELARASVAA